MAAQCHPAQEIAGLSITFNIILIIIIRDPESLNLDSLYTFWPKKTSTTTTITISITITIITIIVLIFVSIIFITSARSASVLQRLLLRNEENFRESSKHLLPSHPNTRLQAITRLRFMPRSWPRLSSHPSQKSGLGRVRWKISEARKDALLLLP